MNNRIRLCALLLQKYASAFDDMIQRYQPNDKLFITENLISYTEAHKKHATEDIGPLLNQISDTIYSHLRANAKDFDCAQLYYFYDPALALSRNNLISQEEYNNTDKGILTEEEYQGFLSQTIRFLHNAKRYFYMEEAETTTNDSGGSESVKSNKEHTTARQALALHFLFQVLNCKSSQLSRKRFSIFLTGKNGDNIYKFLLSPFQKISDKKSIADLEYVRSYFEALNLPEVLVLIDKELQHLKFDHKR